MNSNKGCWSRRTQLEKGFILILALVIPYIICVSAVYISYHVKNNNAKSANTTPTSQNKITTPEKNKIRRSIDECYCPCTKSENLIPHKFISSINENIFTDDPYELKFKCAAAVLDSDHIIAGYECLKPFDSNNTIIKIRSGSEFWSKDGYIRNIAKIDQFMDVFVIIKLDRSLPDDEISVKPIKISDQQIFEVFDVYRWNTVFSKDLKHRKKYQKLEKITMNAVLRNECISVPDNFDGLCVVEHNDFCSNESIGDLIFEVNTNKLLGVEVNRKCVGNTVEHYYNLINKVMKQI